MSMTIEIRGSDTYNESTAAAVTLEALGVKTFLIDESLERRYNGGKYRRIGRFRLGFDIVFNDFATTGSATWQDSRDYFALMELMSKRYMWIHEVGTHFARITDATLGLVTDGRLTLPIEVAVFEMPSFGDDFERAVNTVDGLVLASVDYYQF